MRPQSGLWSIVLTSTVINLWHGQVSSRSNEFYRFLTRDEKGYVSTLANQDMQQRYIQVHGQLRCLLAESLSVDPVALTIAKAEFGKPYLPDYPTVQFNLSHSADYFALAITYDAPVGIDVELFKARKNYTGLAEKCFAKDELIFWNSLPKDRQADVFFRFWTCKEAVVKATGRGIALGLSQCVIDLDGKARLLQIPADYGDAEQWSIQELNLAQGVYAALAVNTSRFQLNIHAL